MQINVQRFLFREEFTAGRLLVDNKFQCWTLEDKYRPDGIKVNGETCIPEGTYKVVINHSEHFNKELPLLLAVPNFEGVRIHSGNTHKDTKGCILVGERLDQNNGFVGNSRVAFGELFTKIKNALHNSELVFITITNNIEA